MFSSFVIVRFQCVRSSLFHVTLTDDVSYSKLCTRIRSHTQTQTLLVLILNSRLVFQVFDSQLYDRREKNNQIKVTFFSLSTGDAMFDVISLMCASCAATDLICFCLNLFRNIHFRYSLNERNQNSIL